VNLKVDNAEWEGIGGLAVEGKPRQIGQGTSSNSPLTLPASSKPEVGRIINSYAELRY